MELSFAVFHRRYCVTLTRDMKQKGGHNMSQMAAMLQAKVSYLKKKKKKRLSIQLFFFFAAIDGEKS